MDTELQARYNVLFAKNEQLTRDLTVANRKVTLLASMLHPYATLVGMNSRTSIRWKRMYRKHLLGAWSILKGSGTAGINTDDPARMDTSQTIANLRAALRVMDQQIGAE